MRQEKHAPATSSTHRVTRRMATDAAIRAVFDTAELLEQIMLQLPPATILTSQRVCHQFQDIVTTSSSIQKVLFFRTSSDYERWPVVRPSGAAYLLEDGSDRADFVTVSARCNDFFRLFQRPLDHRMRNGTLFKPLEKMHDAVIQSLRDSTKVLSCAKMSFTDTPSFSATVCFDWSVGVAAAGTVMTDISIPTGITVRDVIEAIREHRSGEGAQHVYESGRDGRWERVKLPCDSLMQAIEHMELKHGQSAKLQFNLVRLRDVVLPTQEEREQRLQRDGDESAV